MFLDPYEWPIGPTRIADICEVSPTTANRWLRNNHAPGAARKLIQLTQRQRIMPDSWPQHWRINSVGALDIGFTKIALTPAQIEWYFHSCDLWHQLIRIIPEIEARLDELEKRATTATIIELDKYRAQLRKFRERPFLLSNHK